MTNIGGTGERIWFNQDMGKSDVTGQKGVRSYNTGFGAMIAKLRGVGVDLKNENGKVVATVNRDSLEKFFQRNGVTSFSITNGKSLNIHDILPKLTEARAAAKASAAQQNAVTILAHSQDKISGPVNQIRDFIDTLSKAGIQFPQEIKTTLLGGKKDDEEVTISKETIEQLQKAAKEFIEKFQSGRAKVDEKHTPDAKNVAHDASEKPSAPAAKGRGPERATSAEMQEVDARMLQLEGTTPKKRMENLEENNKQLIANVLKSQNQTAARHVIAAVMTGSGENAQSARLDRGVEKVMTEGVAKNSNFAKLYQVANFK